MEDAGQFDQQVNGAAAFTVLHTADMLLACQSQANRQLLLRNATGSANIVKSLTKLFCVKIHTFLLPHSRYRTGPTEGQNGERRRTTAGAAPVCFGTKCLEAGTGEHKSARTA